MSKRHHESVCEVGDCIREDIENANDCFVESHEFTRQRVESSQPKNHENHIAGKGFTSMSHVYLVHKFIPAKAAVDKEWKKLETTPARHLEKVKTKKEAILEAQ